MRLYGNDIDESTRWGRISLGFTGGTKNRSSATSVWPSRRTKASPEARRFEMIDRGIARHGHQVGRREAIVVVTSGTQTPVLKKAIGMAYVPIDLAKPGSELSIDIRGRVSTARVVPMPFYKRSR